MRFCLSSTVRLSGYKASIFLHPANKEKVLRVHKDSGGVRASSLLLLVLGPSHGTWHVGVLLHVLAVRPDRPQLTHEGALIAVVKLAQLGLDGLGGLLSLVEGNATVRFS